MLSNFFFSKTCCRRNYCQKSFSDLTLAAVVSNVWGHLKYAWNQQLLHFSTNIIAPFVKEGCVVRVIFCLKTLFFWKVPKIILWSYNLRKSNNLVLLNGVFCLCNPFGSFSFETFVNRLILIWKKSSWHKRLDIFLALANAIKNLWSTSGNPTDCYPFQGSRLSLILLSLALKASVYN